jgi:hypothetical protein
MDWIAKLPTTNFRTLVGVCLSIFFVAFATIADALGRPLSSETLWFMGPFLGLQMGLDVTQFVMKRRTFQAAAHAAGAVREAAEPPPPVPALAAVTTAAAAAPASTNGHGAPALEAPPRYDRRTGERRVADRRLGGEPLALGAREMEQLAWLGAAAPIERVGALGDRLHFHPLGSHPSLLDDGRDADDPLDGLGTANEEALS